MTLTSGNASGITDSGTVTVGGNLAVTTDASSGVINLGTLAVAGTVDLTTDGTGSATVVNASGLDLAASTVGGTLSATATTGNIIQSGDLTITCPCTFITAADGSDIVLDSSGNAFSAAVTMQADAGDEAFGNITFTDSASINLSSSASSDGDFYINAGTDGAVDGNLGVTATTGNITQATAIAVTGTSAFTTSASNGTITLSEATNELAGAVSLSTSGSSGNVIVVSASGLNLDTSTVGGTLSATATTGDISNSGDLAITGTATFITAETGSNIVLDSSGNDFAAAVTMKADTGGDEAFGNITFVDSDAVKLNSSASADGDLFFDGSTDLAIGGNLGVTATTGNITQGAAIAVTGASSFETSARNATFTMDNSSNIFTGGVTYTVFIIPAQETALNGSNITVGYASIGQTIGISSGIVKRFSNIVLTATGIALKTVFRTINIGGPLVVDLFSENFDFIKMKGANADLTSSVEKAGNIWIRNPVSPPPPHYLLWEDVVEMGRK